MSIRKLLKLPNGSFLKYCAAFVLLLIPLYPKFPLLKVSEIFVSIRLEDIVIALVSTLLLIELLPRMKTFFSNKINSTIILYLTVGLVSLISSIFLTKTVIPHVALLHWLRRVEYFIPFFLGYCVIRNNRGSINFFFKLILIIIFIAFVYGIGQRYFGWPIVITQNEEYSKGVALRWIQGSHINSTFAGHYDLASFLVLVLPIVVTSVFLLKEYKYKILAVAISFSGLWLLVNTASRISLVSYLIAVSISLLLVKKSRYILVVVVISILFIGFSSNLFERYKSIFDVSLRKIRQTSQTSVFVKYAYAEADGVNFRRESVSPTPTPIPVIEDRSSNIRLNVEWPRALRAFLKNPILGTGYSSITLATDNDYLRLLGEVGLFGMISFLLIILRLVIVYIYSLSKLFDMKSIELIFIAGMAGSLVGVLLNAVFIDVFEASKFAISFWLLTGFSMGLIKYENIGNK